MARISLALILLLVGAGCGDSVSDNDAQGGAGGATAATSTGGNGAGGDGSGGTPFSGEPTLPAATGACPDFAPGDVMFSPAGIAARNVRIYMDETATGDGPLVFYWHGWGSSPITEPPYGLGAVMDWVTEQGGIVAAAHSDDASGMFPWYLVSGGDDETDLLLADEVVACAIEKVGIDTTRIHSIGMSAGGLQTTQMSYRRSNYLASVVTYSGGLLTAEPSMQQPGNKFPAMMFHGGPNDVVYVNFKDLTEAYRDSITALGHFAFVCDHGLEHIIPTAQNEQQAVLAFFRDHPWGTVPSPYEAGLPAEMPSYCTL